MGGQREMCIGGHLLHRPVPTGVEPGAQMKRQNENFYKVGEKNQTQQKRILFQSKLHS